MWYRLAYALGWTPQGTPFNRFVVAPWGERFTLSLTYTMEEEELLNAIGAPLGLDYGTLSDWLKLNQ